MNRGGRLHEITVTLIRLMSRSRRLAVIADARALTDGEEQEAEMLSDEIAALENEERHLLKAGGGGE